MEIAWEDFILEEPGSTRALVQANLTTRALVQPQTIRPRSRKHSVTSKSSRASGDSNVIFSKGFSADKNDSTRDEAEAGKNTSDPSENDSGALGNIDPNLKENMISVTCEVPSSEEILQPSVLGSVNIVDEEILVPETITPENKNTED